MAEINGMDMTSILNAVKDKDGSFGNGWGAGFLGWILGAAMNGNGNGLFGGGNNTAQNAQYESLQHQVGTLSQTIADNNTNSQLRDSIGGVNAGIGGLAAGINGLAMAIQQGLCGVKGEIMQQGAAINLGNCQQSNLILQQSQNLTNTVQNGFTQIGYQMEQNACAIKEATLAQTQTILDKLSQQETNALQSQVNMLQAQLSKQEILNAINAGKSSAASTAG